MILPADMLVAALAASLRRDVTQARCAAPQRRSIRNPRGRDRRAIDRALAAWPRVRARLFARVRRAGLP